MAGSTIIIDTILKNKIETLMENNNNYSIKFKDIDDMFFFDTQVKLYNFLTNQMSERYYDKSLRKGYFDYTNEYGETFRYYIEAKRGTLTLLREEILI